MPLFTSLLRFSRKKIATGMADLSKKWYLIFARGPVSEYPYSLAHWTRQPGRQMTRAPMSDLPNVRVGLSTSSETQGQDRGPSFSARPSFPPAPRSAPGSPRIAFLQSTVCIRTRVQCKSIMSTWLSYRKARRAWRKSNENSFPPLRAFPHFGPIIIVSGFRFLLISHSELGLACSHTGMWTSLVAADDSSPKH